MNRVEVSRTVRAPREKVWNLLAKPEEWPAWAPINARNRIVSNNVVRREGNVVVCEQVDKAGWASISHQSRYSFQPTERIVEEMSGALRGQTTITLESSGGGTLVKVEDSAQPTSAISRLLMFLMGGGGVVASFWADVLAQLASVAEGPCSQQSPMYCPSGMLDLYFGAPSLGPEVLVNRGGREIDVESLTVYNDQRWKGIYPHDSPAPAWVFQNGFNKTFTEKDGELTGVTSTFDDTIKGNNKPVLIDPSDSSKGILLQYTDPQYSGFYDVLKVVDKDVVVGKAFVGRYPTGRLLLNFTMARRYSFDFMSAQDHRELFEKYGRAPDVGKISGEWEGRMVSSASLTPPLFRFWYSVDGSGKVSCRWNFMNIMKGNSRIEMTKDQMLMFDFTNFHDEIRMLTPDAMVGRYLPKSQKLLDVVGDRDLGLLHFEKTAEGDRPAIYYYIKRVSNDSAQDSHPSS